MNDISVLDTAQKMCHNLEENFITLGDLLSQIKTQKLYRLKGYETFKHFVEQEYHIVSTKASRLANIFDVFIMEMGIDEQDVKMLGYDKLSLIMPIVTKADDKEKQEWVEKADTLSLSELKDTIKSYKDAHKPVDVKKVFTEQIMGDLQNYLECNKKMFQYMLALYFSGLDQQEIENRIKVNKEKFEASIIGDN